MNVQATEKPHWLDLLSWQQPLRHPMLLPSNQYLLGTAMQQGERPRLHIVVAFQAPARVSHHKTVSKAQTHE